MTIFGACSRNGTSQILSSPQTPPEIEGRHGRVGEVGAVIEVDAAELATVLGECRHVRVHQAAFLLLGARLLLLPL